MNCSDLRWNPDTAGIPKKSSPVQGRSIEAVKSSLEMYISPDCFFLLSVSRSSKCVAQGLLLKWENARPRKHSKNAARVYLSIVSIVGKFLGWETPLRFTSGHTLAVQPWLLLTLLS
jgi:hypothetical protein